MKKIYLIVAALFAMLAGGLALSGPASANETPALDMATVTAADPSFATCSNLDGWYGNPDEQADLPTPTVDGLKFDNKDLIHHKISLSLTDAKAGSFVANGDELKVAFKMETDSPYTSIVQDPTGKFWSSHITTGKGSQGEPVDTIHELIGIPQRGASGGLTEDTKIVSFGVGYWTESGSTVVSSISFHGTKYDLTCKPEPTKTPSSPAPTKTSSKPTPTKSTSHAPAGGSNGGTNGGDSGALAITGPSTPTIIVVGGLILVGGSAAIWATRRRRTKFTA